MTLLNEIGSTENREIREDADFEIKQSLSEIKVEKETSSEEIAEGTYKNTIENVSKEFGDFMPESQRVRIDMEKENYKPTVLSSEAYSERFHEVDPSVLGHYDAEGRIFLKEGSPETIKHVTTHEALHLTSYKELDDSNPNREVYRCGIRESVFTLIGMEENRNQALNEGITELYAVREMMLNGDTASMKEISSYPEAQRKAYELQGIVGSDVIRKAYFGGDIELLESEVNRLSYGDETAWERYSKNVDVLEYGTNSEEIIEARKELTLQNAIMMSFLESEINDEVSIRKK